MSAGTVSGKPPERLDRDMLTVGGASMVTQSSRTQKTLKVEYESAQVWRYPEKTCVLGENLPWLCGIVG